MKEVHIIGAGGHTRSLINLLELNSYVIKGIFDDNFKSEEMINGYQLLGTISDIERNVNLVLSIGDNKRRAYLYEAFYKKLIRDNLIHHKSLIENRAVIGESNQIFANAYINSNAEIGDNNILNTNCIIEHEVRIGNHNHISVGAILAGRTKIGNLCFIGSGAVIIDKVTICDDITIGANSVVIRDIIEPGVYVGNPVRKVL